MLYQNTPVPGRYKVPQGRRERNLFEKEDDLLSNPLGHLIGLKAPNSGGATSIAASSPWGCECEVGGMDLGPLFFCNFEIIWKNSMPAYRDDPRGQKTCFNLFFLLQSVA